MNNKNSLQWIVIAFVVVILAAVTVNAISNQRSIASLEKRLAAVSENDGAITPPKIVPIPPIANTPVAQPQNLPPQVVGIPGVNATVRLAGDWKLVTSKEYLQFVKGDSTISIDRHVIGDKDLQQWFKDEHYWLDEKYFSTIVEQVNATIPSMGITRGDFQQIGPNQVKINGNLAIDETIIQKKTVFPETGYAQTVRYVAVRRGGDVILFQMDTPTTGSDVVGKEWDTMLNSLTFAQ